MNRKVIEMVVEPIKPTNGDDWIKKAEIDDSALPNLDQPHDKRLTVTISSEVHRRLKLHCVATGILMNDFVKSVLERALAVVPPVKS